MMGYSPDRMSTFSSGHIAPNSRPIAWSDLLSYLPYTKLPYAYEYRLRIIMTSTGAPCCTLQQAIPCDFRSRMAGGRYSGARAGTSAVFRQPPAVGAARMLDAERIG